MQIRIVRRPPPEEEEHRIDDSAYSEDWGSDALNWERLGLYREIAELLDLPPNYRYLDLCCGYGNLLRAVKTTHPDGIAVGADINEHSVRQAHTNLQFAELRGILNCKSETTTKKGPKEELSK